MYGQKVMEHFLNPHRTGELKEADGIGVLGDPACGDFIKIYIKVIEDRIADISFQIKGCPAAIACGSAVTDLALGKTLDEASEICDEDVLDYLEGLPPEKEHCSNLGAGALHKAIFDYVRRTLQEEAHVKV